MADFESNPDIDEKPPISLRDALEKMKPFLMAYENIQSHEEWEVKNQPFFTCSIFCQFVNWPVILTHLFNISGLALLTLVCIYI